MNRTVLQATIDQENSLKIMYANAPKAISPLLSVGLSP